jgi:outer membrane immunogenic protein
MTSRKQTLIGLTFIVSFGLAASAGSASAADLALPAAAPAAYNWTGLYLGINAGYASATNTETLNGGGLGGSGSVNLPAFAGGLQVGGNYQAGSLVLGFEADFDALTANQSIAFGPLTGTAQVPWLGTLRGRVGWAFDRYLVYATAGGAGGELRSNLNLTGIGGTSATDTFGAWTAGGGLEVGITGALSARLEYLYLQSDSVSIVVNGPPAVTADNRVRDSMVRAGLNYRLPVAW